MALFQKSVVAQRDVYAQRSGVPWCNGAIGDIAQNGPREWKKRSGYHRRLPVENTLYRWLIWGGAPHRFTSDRVMGVRYRRTRTAL
jgi:hypothetical protein